MIAEFCFPLWLRPARCWSRIITSLPRQSSEPELLKLTEKDRQSQATNQASWIESLPAAERIPVKLLKYSPGELTFEVQCATDGWLLVTDRWARSWRAEINERPVEVYGGNFIFRAVQVQAGQNKIRFTYQPFGFPWLVILSWGTMAVIVLYSIYRRWRIRRFPTAGGGKSSVEQTLQAVRGGMIIAIVERTPPSL